MLESAPTKKRQKKITAHIKEIVATHQVKTQQELLDLLAKQGVEANQSLVSRIMHSIGVRKIQSQGELIYKLPGEDSPPILDSGTRTQVLHLSHNGTMIVISTTPGAAPLVARALDFEKEKLSILGTLAGDDVIFVAPTKTDEISRVFEDIFRLIY